jgi:hypothetical protein
MNTSRIRLLGGEDFNVNSDVVYAWCLVGIAISISRHCALHGIVSLQLSGTNKRQNIIWVETDKLTMEWYESWVSTCIYSHSTSMIETYSYSILKRRRCTLVLVGVYLVTKTLNFDHRLVACSQLENFS